MGFHDDIIICEGGHKSELFPDLAERILGELVLQGVQGRIEREPRMTTTGTSIRIAIWGGHSYCCVHGTTYERVDLYQVDFVAQERNAELFPKTIVGGTENRWERTVPSAEAERRPALAQIAESIARRTIDAMAPTVATVLS